MKNRRDKSIIFKFSIFAVLLVVMSSHINKMENYASTQKVSVEETTKKKPVGHKIDGAEYHEELWEKKRVIAADNGGGSGEGGGAKGKNTKEIGNNGTYNDAGGVFGKSAGKLIGSGDTENKSGKGSEVKAETKVKETQKYYDSPGYIEETKTKETVRYTIEYVETVAPTAQIEDVFQKENSITPTAKYIEPEERIFETEDVGSKGGDDPEKDPDMAGSDADEENAGNAYETGKYQKETEGEFAGKKIFEFERNGDIGINPDGTSIKNVNKLLVGAVSLLLLLGGLTFVIGSKDIVNKKNYF